MKPSSRKFGPNGICGATIPWLSSNIGFTTNTKQFYYEHRWFLPRYRQKFCRHLALVFLPLPN